MKKLILILLTTISLQGYSQIRLSDLNNKSSITGTEKIPVSGSGNPSITPNLLKTFINAAILDSLEIKANLDALEDHIADIANPHAVTKTQVGLGNADNTSDTNKPVSTATQTALNAKQATLVSGTNIKTINGSTILGSGDLVVSGGGGGGVVYTFASSAPATTAIWVDTGNAYANAYPIRYYINGAWTTVTETCDWWDTIGGVVSKGRPVFFLFSGQSNAGVAAYTPYDDPTYLGDITPEPLLTIWPQVYSTALTGSAPDAWEVYQYNSTYYSGVTHGANNVQSFAKEYIKEFKRSVRLVGVATPGTGLADWETGNASWTRMVAEVAAAGVTTFDAFLWIHGEGNLGVGSAFSTYAASFYDLIGRIRALSWGGNKIKILATGNAVSHALDAVDIIGTDMDGAEATSRGLEEDQDPYTGWAQNPPTRDLQYDVVGMTGPVGDALHFTTREQEYVGKSMFSRYKQLPDFGRKIYPMNVTLTRVGTVTTAIHSVYQYSDDVKLRFASYTSNAGAYVHSFGFKGETSKFTVLPQGVSGRANFEWWTSSTTSAAISSDKALQINYLGSTFNKPIIVYNSLGVNTGGVGNTGTGVLNFWGGSQTEPVPIGTNAQQFIAAVSTGASSQASLTIATGGNNVDTNNRIRIMPAGHVGIGGVASPSAILHLAAGTATAGTAPIKFTSGTNTTTAVAGQVEWDGTNLFFTRTGTTRGTLIQSDAVNSVSPTAPNRTITVNIGGTTYYIAAKTTND